MERTRKIWGERWLIRQDSTHANSVLVLNAGYECSWHRHQAKFNKFVVLKGLIGIVVGENGQQHVTHLRPGNEFTTKPGQWHKFQAYENSIVVEEMYVSYDEGDIERETVGGAIGEEAQVEYLKFPFLPNGMTFYSTCKHCRESIRLMSSGNWMHEEYHGNPDTPIHDPEPDSTWEARIEP